MNHMSFEIALVEKVYKRLNEAYILNIENLKRIYKDEKIITYRRILHNKKKMVYSTECIICTMTWPGKERLYFDTKEEFVKHIIDHIPENRLGNK